MDLYFSPVAQLELDEAFAYLEGEKTWSVPVFALFVLGYE